MVQNGQCMVWNGNDLVQNGNIIYGMKWLWYEMTVYQSNHMSQSDFLLGMIFNFEHSKTLWCSRELKKKKKKWKKICFHDSHSTKGMQVKSKPDNKTLDLSKSKAFSDDK